MKQYLFHVNPHMVGFPGGSVIRYPPSKAGDMGSILGWEHPLEEGMATHSSILAWRIPRTEGPGGLQSTGSQRVRHDWVAHASPLCTWHAGFLPRVGTFHLDAPHTPAGSPAAGGQFWALRLPPPGQLFAPAQGRAPGESRLCHSAMVPGVRACTHCRHVWCSGRTVGAQQVLFG